jgi:hypothetical protein
MSDETPVKFQEERYMLTLSFKSQGSQNGKKKKKRNSGPV